MIFQRHFAKYAFGIFSTVFYSNQACFIRWITAALFWFRYRPYLLLLSRCPDMGDLASPSAYQLLLSRLAPAAQNNGEISDNCFNVTQHSDTCNPNVHKRTNLPPLEWQVLLLQEAADSSVCPQTQVWTVQHLCTQSQQGASVYCHFKVVFHSSVNIWSWSAYLPERTIITRGKLCTVAQHWGLEK